MKALIFHGSPYNILSFNTLEYFKKECLLQGNGGILGHYFYYTTKDLCEEKLIETIIIPQTLRHACEKDGLRGVKGTTGYVYIGVIGINKFMDSEAKESLSFYIKHFSEYFSEIKLNQIYAVCKNNKKLINRITRELAKQFDYNTIADILSSTGYRGIKEPCDWGFSTLYCWDNTFITENKIVQKLKVTKISTGSSIDNYNFE